MKLRRLTALLLALLMLAGLLSGCESKEIDSELIYAIEDALIESYTSDEAADGQAEALIPDSEAPPEEPTLDIDGEYSTKEDVALYIHLYGCLPKNFITKNEAREAGWSGGGLDDYFYGMSIGGDRFGNYEKLLPDAKGRTWTECDINAMHKSSRGAERIVFSNDGLIYYTGDHYESFEEIVFD